MALNNGDTPPAPGDKSKIIIEDLYMEFPDHRRTNASSASAEKHSVHVLEDVNLSVDEGEFVCIVGPSGCGKSTLLNIIGGFLKATRGRVSVDGAPVTGPNLKRIFIFQENGTFPWLTVEANIGFGLLNRPVEERQRVVKHYIEMVGLKGFEKSYPREISGGMKQRVEIARALAANPDVLYMDEPFGALDFLTRLRMRAELVEIWRREKKTVLFVTHDVEESVQLADRVVVMSRSPATITTIIDVKLPRPRDLDSPEYLSIRDEIFEVMGLDHSGIISTKGGGVEDEAASAARMAASPLRTKKLDADVIIIGGGPAGSVLGAYLSRAGIDHLIIDKAHHPRAHVGESLSYSTTGILKEIDFLPVMEREGFVIKRGVSWTSCHGQEQIDIDFGNLGEPSHSYQVDRAKFDDLLLRHAREGGSRVFSGALVERVSFSRQGFATGVTVKVGESRFPLKCRLVIDASGGQAILGRQLRIMRTDHDLPRFALHSWFTGVDRGKAATSDFTHIHLLPIQRGWIWQIPIDDEITSVGVVTDEEHHVKSGEEVDQFFKWMVSMNSTVANRMSQARRLREYRLDGNYGYSMERFVGDGWMLVGDAAFSVDPIFSSGISDAIHCAKFAAAAIENALDANDTSESFFKGYEETLRRGAGIRQELIRLFYETSPIFIRVVAESDYRDKIVRLCEGEVYDPSARQTLDSLRRMFESIRVAESHPLKKFLPERAI